MRKEGARAGRRGMRKLTAQEAIDMEKAEIANMLKIGRTIDLTAAQEGSREGVVHSIAPDREGRVVGYGFTVGGNQEFIGIEDLVRVLYGGKKVVRVPDSLLEEVFHSSRALMGIGIGAMELALSGYLLSVTGSLLLSMPLAFLGALYIAGVFRGVDRSRRADRGSGVGEEGVNGPDEAEGGAGGRPAVSGG